MDSIPFLELKSQYQNLKQEIDRSVMNVLERGWYILGREVESLEKEFASYCGVRCGVGVGSGTEALHLALLAVGVQPGDKVITVPNTAVPTVSAITFAGAEPLFVDVEPENYTMDPNKLETSLSGWFENKELQDRIRAVIPVHLYGRTADMDPIMELAGRYHIKVVEDCCQAHGASYKGSKAGTFGDAGCFSFYPSKNLGAIGDGGMVVTDDSTVGEKVRMLRQYGEVTRYHHSIKGFNSRLDEIQAAVLRVKLKHLDRWNGTRNRLAGLYRENLAGLPLTLPSEHKDCEHVYHLFVIRTERRDELMDYLRQRGVGTLIHYPIPIHRQEAYQDLGLSWGSFPEAEACAREILSLPLYPELEENTLQEICSTIRSFFEDRS